MNKPKPAFSVFPPQKAMPVMQNLDESCHSIDEVLFALSVVVKMNFNVSDTRSRHFRKRIEERSMVFLLRIEERVDRRPASGVSVPGG